MGALLARSVALDLLYIVVHSNIILSRVTRHAEIVSHHAPSPSHAEKKTATLEIFWKNRHAGIFSPSREDVNT